jgi:hypothetical protein
MACTFQVQGYPPPRVISVRPRSAARSLPEVMGRTCAAIAAYLEANKVQPAGVPFAAYSNMDCRLWISR